MAPNPLEGLLGNSTFQQLMVWNILGQLISTSLAPAWAGLQAEAFRLDQPIPLPVADAVDAYIKSHIDLTRAQLEAAMSGIDNERLSILVDSAGEPPGLDFLTEAFRRGFIPKSGTGPEATSLEQGIRESRLKNKWVGVVEQMQYRLPDPSVVLEAWLRAQLTEAQALDLLAKAGIDEPTARVWYASLGRPPGPGELIELYRRGEIPLDDHDPSGTSLRQGYLETDLKNKWYDAWLKLARYVPPPRTVTAMVREGALNDQQALAYFKDAGLPSDLAAAYLEAAHHQRTAATKELAKTDILTLLMDELIDEATALKDLEALGYAPETASFEIEIARFRAEHVLLNQTLTRLRTLYVAHKLDKQAALTALDALGLSPAARDKQLAYWEQARANNVAILTAAQIGDAVKLGWLDHAEGLNLLEGHGYTAHDAALYLVVHLKLAPGDSWPDGAAVVVP